jgi:uncharacterized protein (TIGR03435 family)
LKLLLVDLKWGFVPLTIIEIAEGAPYNRAGGQWNVTPFFLNWTRLHRARRWYAESMGRCLLLVLLPALLAQTPQPTFEVVDIKPSDPSNPTPRGKGRVLPGGRIELPGGTLKELIMFAYGVQEDMISGGPDWATRDRYDVVAKGPENASPEAVRPMLQALLADSFKLTIHRVDKVQSAFVLTLGKRPPRYIEGDGGRQQCAWSVLESGLNRRECHNLSMAEFARQLPGTGNLGIDLPVIDQMTTAMPL